MSRASHSRTSPPRVTQRESVTTCMDVAPPPQHSPPSHPAPVEIFQPRPPQASPKEFLNRRFVLQSRLKGSVELPSRRPARQSRLEDSVVVDTISVPYHPQRRCPQDARRARLQPLRLLRALGHIAPKLPLEWIPDGQCGRPVVVCRAKCFRPYGLACITTLQSVAIATQHHSLQAQVAFCPHLELQPVTPLRLATHV